MEEYSYYLGYQLNDTVYLYDLDDLDKKILDSAIWYVENNTTIRKTACEFSLSKSVLHRYFCKNLPKLSYELNRLVQKQRNKNKLNKGYFY